MAYICKKPAGSCETCPHWRYDVEYGSKVCYAAVDEYNKVTQKRRKLAVNCTLYLDMCDDDTAESALDRLMSRLRDDEIGWQIYKSKIEEC